MGIETSAEHGGSESSFTSAIIAIEELAKVDPSVSVLCDVHNTLVNTVIRKYVHRNNRRGGCLSLLSQRLVSYSSVVIDPNPDMFYSLAAFVCQELASGSDAFALQTRAMKDGDNWIINGSKMWITNSYEAEVFLVFANVRASCICERKARSRFFW